MCWLYIASHSNLLNLHELRLPGIHDNNAEANDGDHTEVTLLAVRMRTAIEAFHLRLESEFSLIGTYQTYRCL